MNSHMQKPSVSRMGLVVLLVFFTFFETGRASQDKPAAQGVASGGAGLQLFLLIGQSNMAGRGSIEPQDREIIPRVFMLDKELQWVPATDPLHFDGPGAGVGVGRSFARVLAAHNKSVSIGFIPCAVGATSLGQWRRGGKLYENAINRTCIAMKSGKLRGILWHQGERDSVAEADARLYMERFSTFVQGLRADLDAPDVPVLVGQLCERIYRRPDGRYPFAAIVNQQLALLPLHVAHCGFVSAAGLKDKGDLLHFDSPSLRELGRRYACGFLALDPTWTSLGK